MKSKFLTTLLLLIAFNLFSQTAPVPAQLSELIKKAIDNYPKLKAGNEMVRLSEVQRDQAYGGYMPQVDLEATYRYAKPTPSVSFSLPDANNPGQTINQTLSFIPANNYDIHVGLRQTIWDFGRTQADVKRTLTEIQTSKDNLEANKSLLAYQVAQIYYGIIFTNKEIAIQSDQIRLFEENERIVNDKIKNGDALKFDLLSTQVKKSNAQNTLVDLQTALQKRYQLLNMLTANTGEGYITSSDVNLNEVVVNTSSTADNNLEVIAQAGKLNSYEWQIKSANRQLLPSITGNAKIGYQNGIVPEVNKLQLAGSVGVGLSVPIFSVTTLKYRTKMAQISRNAAEYDLQAQKLTVNKDLLVAQSDITASEKKLKNYELQVERAEEAQKLANIRYKAGVITNLEFLTAQADLEEARLGKTQLEYNLLLSKLDLNKLGGVKIW